MKRLQFKTSFRVLDFISKIPNIKIISNEHFNLWEAGISLDEIIKFRWSHKILKLINLKLMMALQQNFKRVLLNCAPCFTQLHPAYSNLHPPPPSSLFAKMNSHIKQWKVDFFCFKVHATLNKLKTYQDIR